MEVKEKYEDIYEWLDKSLPINPIYFKLDDNWHPQKQEFESEISIVHIPKKILNLTIWQKIKKKFYNFFQSLWENIVNTFLEIKKGLDKANSKEPMEEFEQPSLNSVVCCLCGSSEDTDEDPLRLVKISGSEDQFGLVKPHYLFQYFLLKNLGVIPQMPQGHTYVHYKCAKSADPSKICPFTGNIITSDSNFKIGNISISKKARETFFPSKKEEQVKSFNRILESLRDYGFCYSGTICLLEEIPSDEYIEKEKDREFYEKIQSEFSGISSHFQFFLLRKDVLLNSDYKDYLDRIHEESSVHGIYISPGASLYEAEMSILRYFLIHSLRSMLPPSSESSMLKSIILYWMEAEFIRRHSNNQVYLQYYIESSLANDPKALEIGKKIIKERKSHPVSIILSDVKVMSSKAFVENYLKHTVVTLGFVLKSELIVEEKISEDMTSDHVDMPLAEEGIEVPVSETEDKPPENEKPQVI